MLIIPLISLEGPVLLQTSHFDVFTVNIGASTVLVTSFTACVLALDFNPLPTNAQNTLINLEK